MSAPRVHRAMPRTKCAVVRQGCCCKYYTTQCATRCDASCGAGLAAVRHTLQIVHDQTLLRALAAVAVTGAAFAQSSVTISGSLDFAAISNGKETSDAGAGTAATSDKTSSTGAANSWTTNQISISGSEDLGGGLTASFVVNQGLAGADPGRVVGSRDTNLALSGGFGTVRMGRFAPAAATGFHGLSGSASVAVGSIYHLTAASAASARFAPNMAAGNFERNNNNLQYTTPNFNGFTVNVNYGSTSEDSTAFAGKAKTTQTGLSATYAAGPLTVALGMNDRKITAEGADLAVAGNTIKGDLNWIAASYDLGMARVFFTQVNRKDVTTAPGAVGVTNTDAKVNQFGVSVPMGAITINASTYSGKDKRGVATTDNAKLSGNQVSVRYALSKRTSVYALMGTNEIKRDGASTINARKQTANMVGLLHTF